MLTLETALVEETGLWQDALQRKGYLARLPIKTVRRRRKSEVASRRPKTKTELTG